MAIVWFEHFDLYGGTTANLMARGYDTFSVNGTMSTTSPRNGSHCFLIAGNSTNQHLRRALPAPANVAGVGAAIQRISNGVSNSASVGVRLENGSVSYAAVVNAENGISLYSGATLLASSAPSIVPADTYVWLELKVDADADTIAARLNNTPIVNATATIAPMTHFMVGKYSGAPTARIDDIVVWDGTGSVNNDWIGDTFVLVAAPNADGAVNQWSASTGTDRWAMIDEASPSEADFISAASIGLANEFSHVALNLPAGSVAAIGVQARANKNDAGASSINLGIASGSQSSMSSEIALATGVVAHAHIANLNPDGNVPWTQSAAQAARLRVQRVI